MPKSADRTGQKVLKRLVATDARSLRKFLNLIEDRLRFRMLKGFLRQLRNGKGKGKSVGWSSSTFSSTLRGSQGLLQGNADLQPEVRMTGVVQSNHQFAVLPDGGGDDLSGIQLHRLRIPSINLDDVELARQCFPVIHYRQQARKTGECQEKQRTLSGCWKDSLDKIRSGKSEETARLCRGR